MQNYQNKTAREDMRAQGARAGLENRRKKEGIESFLIERRKKLEGKHAES